MARLVYSLCGGAWRSVHGRTAFPTELIARWYGGRA
jgi:hypothetical protein